MSRPKLTFFYIVEPPEYQVMASMLLASIREYFPADVAVVGYCPEHRMHELHPGVIRAHEMLGAEIRPMKTIGMWDTPYPHGNKLVAALQPRDSEYSAFIDSDVVFLEPNTIEALVKPGAVSVSVAASMGWGEQSIWDRIYGHFDMPVPEERVALMRRKRRLVVPYFSSGLVVFPEGSGSPNRFADVWYDTARTVDRDTELPERRPYLDQMTLPIAIQRAGLHWNLLPEEQHFILGGRLRGKPLPEGRKLYTVHYRGTKILRETGLIRKTRDVMKRHYGVRFVSKLAPSAAAIDEEGGAAPSQPHPAP